MAHGFSNCFSQRQGKSEEYKERKNKGSSWSQQWQTPHWVPKAPLSSVIGSLQSKEIVLEKQEMEKKNKAYANCPNYSTNSYQRHSKRIIEKSRPVSSWLLLKPQQKLYVFTLWQKIEEDLWIIKMSFLFICQLWWSSQNRKQFTVSVCSLLEPPLGEPEKTRYFHTL